MSDSEKGFLDLYGLLFKNLNNTMLQFFPMNNDEEACQPETRAIMSWVRQIHFTASASLHGVISLIQSLNLVKGMHGVVFPLHAYFVFL